jgi:hypothetical protein
MRILPISGIIFLLAISAHGAVIFYQTDNYRAKSDSPFDSMRGGGQTYVENFETQGTQRPRSLLTTPNATGWNGVASGSSQRGVQEDYSGDNLYGRVWNGRGSHPETNQPPTGIHFDFTPDAQGRLPDYAGAALLGRHDPNGTGLLYNSIFVYDKNGMEVTGGEWKFVRPPDVFIPVEDLFLNFYGIHVPGGISRIHFRDFLEVDHLTYGYSAIPEPASAGLAAAAALAFGLRRKRLA